MTIQVNSDVIGIVIDFICWAVLSFISFSILGSTIKDRDFGFWFYVSLLGSAFLTYLLLNYFFQWIVLK